MFLSFLECCGRQCCSRASLPPTHSPGRFPAEQGSGPKGAFCWSAGMLGTCPMPLGTNPLGWRWQAHWKCLQGSRAVWMLATVSLCTRMYSPGFALPCAPRTCTCCPVKMTSWAAPSVPGFASMGSRGPARRQDPARACHHPETGVWIE